VGFNRQPEHFMALLMRTQRPDNQMGKWEPISRWGYVVLAPNEHELHEFACYIGPRIGFPPPWGVIDTRYEHWLFRNHLKKYHYGRPTGKREMLYAELVAGWFPGSDLLETGKASPGIIDGVMEPRDWSQRNSTDATIADMIAASMAAGY
jgi:hypothetical protein